MISDHLTAAYSCFFGLILLFCVIRYIDFKATKWLDNYIVNESVIKKHQKMMVDKKRVPRQVDETFSLFNGGVPTVSASTAAFACATMMTSPVPNSMAMRSTPTGNTSSLVCRGVSTGTLSLNDGFTNYSNNLENQENKHLIGSGVA